MELAHSMSTLLPSEPPVFLIYFSSGTFIFLQKIQHGGSMNSKVKTGLIGNKS